jgi:CheY-specific phosphatase CheX
MGEIFASTGKTILDGMLQTQTVWSAPNAGPVKKGDISSFISVSGTLRGEARSGLLFLVLKEVDYLAWSSAMLGEPCPVYLPELADVGSEIVNIVLGRSKQRLLEMGFSCVLTSPSTIRGIDHQLSFPTGGICTQYEVRALGASGVLGFCCTPLKG